MNGKCQNGSCERLATRVVVLAGIGEREMCHFCEQALTGLGMDLRPRDGLGLSRLRAADFRQWRDRPVPA